MNEPQIMQGEEPKPQHLVLVDEVADERTRESLTRRATAALLQRPLVPRIAGVVEIHPAGPRQRRPGPGGASRQDAVEHVDPRGDHPEHALGVAEPHEVPRPVGGEQRRGPADRCQHLLPALPDGQASERVSVEPERDDLLDRAAPKLGIGAALRDPEAQLPRRAGRVDLPPRPERRPPTASSCSARVESAGGQMSRHIAMSEPSFRWISATPRE